MAPIMAGDAWGIWTMVRRQEKIEAMETMSRTAAVMMPARIKTGRIGAAT